MSKDAKDGKGGHAIADVSIQELGSSSEENREGETRLDSNRSAANADVNTLMPQFRLYKRRHVGVLGIIALNIVGGMNLTWFGPISNKTSQTFGITLDQVNWLGNIAACTYIVVAPLVPLLCSRFGLRISYAIGTCFLIISAWVRFAGTAQSLSSHGAYTLLIIGQFLSAVPQIIFQVLAPKFSETWFDLKGRTTATMLMSVSNPVGTALGQLISPMITNIRTSILVLGIISTAVCPLTLLIGAKPPTPPSYSGSQPSHHILTTLRAIFGLLSQPLYNSDRSVPSNVDPVSNLDSPVSKTSSPKSRSSAEDQVIALGRLTPDAGPHAVEEEADLGAYMTLRERIDFFILTLVFSVLVSGVNTFSILSNQILEPYGYSEETAGLMGAVLLLSGLVAAFATAPLFDRVLTHHLGLSVRVVVPIIAAAWLSLIWAVRPNNTGGLYAVFVVIGVCSISMLPVALELGCELTRNSETSSAILWCSANMSSLVFILVMSALRASSSASPPENMHRALIFMGASIFSGAIFAVLFRGRQHRREKDARVAAAAQAAADHTRTGERSPGAEGSEVRNVKRRLPLRIFGRSEEGGVTTN